MEYINGLEIREPKTRIEKYKKLRQEIQNDIDKLLNINIVYEDTINGESIYSLEISDDLHKILSKKYGTENYDDLLSIDFEEFLKRFTNAYK